MSALLLTGFAAVTLGVLAGGVVPALDHAVYDALLTYLGPGVTWWCWFAAQTGNEYLLLPTTGLACLAAAVRQRSVWPLVVTFVTGAGLGLVVPAIKILTGRTSPRSGTDEVFAGGTEYPSGHAVNGIVLWGLVFELLVVACPILRRWLRPGWRTFLTTVAGAASGLGMVGLHYHWLSDAVGGWLLGAAIWVVVRPVVGKLAQRRDRAGQGVSGGHSA